jgi:hypothetical protein
VIVWSRGLGKQRLPLELPAASLRVTAENLVMEGMIDPVCWRYAIRLSPEDLSAFLRILAQPRTARFLAERPVPLISFVLRVVAMVPRLIVRFLARGIRARPVAE